MKNKSNIFRDYKKVCIIGTGGFAREVLTYVIDIYNEFNMIFENKICFLEKDEYCKEETIMGFKVIPESNFDPEKYVVIIGVGDPIVRKKIVEKYPTNTEYCTLIHPTAIVSNWVQIREGAVICPGVVLTCNINIGKHAHLNLNTTIGHDCNIGEFFTTAPAVNISGNCEIGDCVYFGTNSAIKQGVNVSNNVTVGMGAVVTKNIIEPGIYIGNPLKKLIK